LNLRNPIAIASVALALGACVIGDDDNDDRPSRPGELGAGDFVYVCVGDSDPLCANGAVAETFPERIAVGARFGLDYNPNDTLFSDGVGLRLDAPNAAVVRRDLDAFFIQQAGYQVFLAVTNESEVIDIQHILAANIDRIAVRTMDSQDLDTIELSPGESITVEAVPQDALRSTLAGSLDYTWTIEDESIAAVASVDEDFDVTIEAAALGSTVLTIETAGFSQQVFIDVADGETQDTEGSDTDAFDPETDTDDSTDTDTDTDGGTGA
jgi:hypothetical protein